MKPKPLHPSLTFWSGIFIMLFIAWAWRDSMKMTSYVSQGRYIAFHNYGVILLRKNAYSAPSEARREAYQNSAPLFLPVVFYRGGIAAESDVAPGEGASYDEQLRIYMSTEPPGTWILILPHWLLLLAVALPWGWLLLWRARRHRAVQAITAPAA